MERASIRVLWDSMRMQLNEMQRRQYAATLAKAYGYGGATVVHEVTGISLNTITAGKKELECKSNLGNGRVRKAGGGPKWLKKSILIFKNAYGKSLTEAHMVILNGFYHGQQRVFAQYKKH